MLFFVVLVATAAAEEGIDVPGVSAVISYDAIKQVKSYVQMRGRCRFSLSRFVVFISNENELKRYKQATKVESDLFDWISERPCPIVAPEQFLETAEEQAADLNETVFSYKEMYESLKKRNGGVDVHCSFFKKKKILFQLSRQVVWSNCGPTFVCKFASSICPIFDC